MSVGLECFVSVNRCGSPKLEGTWVNLGMFCSRYALSFQDERCLLDNIVAVEEPARDNGNAQG